MNCLASSGVAFGPYMFISGKLLLCMLHMDIVCMYLYVCMYVDIHVHVCMYVYRYGTYVHTYR